MRYFGGLTLINLNEAFDLYSSQQLDFKGAHFNSFDKVFLGKVLNSYQNHKNKERSKPKQFSSNQKHIWSYEEKKSHFNYLLNDLFLKESKGTGRQGEFPNFFMAAFKEVHEYMRAEGYIKTLEGDALKKRLQEIRAKEMISSQNVKRSKIISADDIENGRLTSIYYRYEVLEWFEKNKDKLI